MKEGLWGFVVISLGIFVFVVIMLVQTYTNTNESDYYILKEASEAAMMDSVDYAYYWRYGDLRINKEKFVENFIRRFSETTTANRDYKIDFYDIKEFPPKVSIRVVTETGDFTINSDTANINIVNTLDAILETKEYKPDPKNMTSNIKGSDIVSSGSVEKKTINDKNGKAFIEMQCSGGCEIKDSDIKGNWSSQPKTITLRNIADNDAVYSISWDSVLNDIDTDKLTYTLTGKASVSNKKLGKYLLENVSIGKGETQSYNLTLKYNE